MADRILDRLTGRGALVTLGLLVFVGLVALFINHLVVPR